MEASLKFSWVVLALLHVMPAMVFFAPGLVEKLYSASPEGDIGILLIHRGALFLAVCIAALYAVFSPDSRRLASLVLTVSMLGFLIVYARADMPAGALRKIAVADLAGLIPLVWVSIQAWR